MQRFPSYGGEQDRLAIYYDGHSSGVWTMPPDFVKPYETIRAEQAKGPRADPKKIALLRYDAEQAIRGNDLYGTLILNILRPVLAEKVAELAADIEVLGPAWCAHLAPTNDLLFAPEPVREAFMRWLGVDVWYQRIRMAWEAATLAWNWEPRGTDFLLTEVENIEEILPDWHLVGRFTSRGHHTPPWEGTASALRLAWIIANGGQLWLPTKTEYDQAYEAWLFSRTDRGRAIHGSVHTSNPASA